MVKGVGSDVSYSIPAASEASLHIEAASDDNYNSDLWGQVL